MINTFPNKFYYFNKYNTPNANVFHCMFDVAINNFIKFA